MYNKRIISILVLCCVLFAHIQVVTAASTGTNIRGDVDLNGVLNVKDATKVQKHLAALDVLTGACYDLADANNDGEVTIRDATYIQKIVAGFINPVNGGGGGVVLPDDEW